MTGTPKTLKEAITNGIIDGAKNPMEGDYVQDKVNRRVRDYLAQKFGVPLLKHGDNEDARELICGLWREITGENL